MCIRDRLEAGVHFGHLRKKWNPKMLPYIFAEKKGIHIIDPVSYTHLRAHETVLDLVCRLLLEKKKDATCIIYLFLTIILHVITTSQHALSTTCRVRHIHT